MEVLHIRRRKLNDLLRAPLDAVSYYHREEHASIHRHAPQYGDDRPHQHERPEEQELGDESPLILAEEARTREMRLDRLRILVVPTLLQGAVPRVGCVKLLRRHRRRLAGLRLRESVGAVLE